MRSRTWLSLALVLGSAATLGSGCGGDAFMVGGGAGGGSTTSASTSTGDAATVTSSAASTSASTGTGGSCSKADNDKDGYSQCTGDCDDTDPLVHPGVAEICGDGKDNDCKNGVDDGCKGLGTFVSTSTGDDSNPGTQLKPVKTITKGIANAVQIGTGVDVYIAQGFYIEDVNVVEGVSLIGGYTAGTWAYDAKNLGTAILPVKAEGVTVDASITSATELRTLTIKGNNGQISMGAFAHGAALTVQGGTPKLTDDLIGGPDETTDQIASIGLLLIGPPASSSGVQIDSCVIAGGKSKDRSSGVHFAAQMPGAVAFISRSALVGGTARVSTGLYLGAPGPKTSVFDSVIQGGLSTGGSSWGISGVGSMTNPKVDIERNQINVDAPGLKSGAACVQQSSVCGGIDSQGLAADVKNNVIRGASAVTSTAIWLRNTDLAPGTLVLNSNYLDGGGMQNGSPTTSAAVVLTAGAGDNVVIGRIRNNILLGGQGAIRYGVLEESGALKTAHPEALEYNVFFFPSPLPTDVVYRMWDGAAPTDTLTVDDLNKLPGLKANLYGDPLDDSTFHLMPGSPCIDNGTSIEAPPLDRDGASRPKNGKFDIGPDEL